MESSPNLVLPYIMPSQAQAHVTHNEAIRALDALVQMSAESRALTAPPASPTEGMRHIVGTPATGDWFGHDGELAAWQDGGWVFFTPKEGWRCWCADEQVQLVHSAGAWIVQPVGATPTGIEELGVNTTADGTNRLAVRADATLLTNEDGDHRLAINKAASGDTASIIFQTGFAGHAEIGLTGSDDLAVRASPDGSIFVDALVVESESGRVTMPASAFLSDYAINLYDDSGRFGGAGATDVAIGSFSWPGYLTLLNSSSAAGLAKFITNNTDYGGDAGSLNPAVKDLIDRIRDASFRRFGVEFWVAQITQGSGTSNPFSSGGTTFHETLASAPRMRAPAMTFHAYVKAIDDDILLRRSSGQTIYKDGEASTDHVHVSPSEGWVSVRIEDIADPRQTDGYQPAVLSVYGKAPGNKWLLACPALMAGISKVDDDIGVVAACNSWGA